MDIILIFGSLFSFFIAIFLLVKKKDKIVADRILAFWLIILSLDFIRCYMLFFKGQLFLLGLGYTLPLLIAPFLYLYVVYLIDNKKNFDLHFLWHLIPFALANVYMYFYIYTKPAEWRVEFFEGTSISSRPVMFNIILVIVVLVYPVYVIWIYRLLKKHVRNIKGTYSCRKHVDLFWVNYLLVSIIVLWFITLYSKFVSGYFNSLHYSNATMTIYFSQLVIIMIIGYFGFKQGMVWICTSGSEKDVADMTKYKTSGLSSNDAKNFLPVLIKYMETEKPYLNSQLSISELAEKLNMPSNHLSQIINEQTGKNFFEFINSFRVEEVKLQISDNQDKKFTLLAIAFDSGFNSKSSFNSIFKKQTGLTPKQYMNNQAA